MAKAIHIPDHLLFDGNLPSADVLRQLETMQPAEAGLSDWQKARLGKITASRFNHVAKLKNSGQWGDTALSYLYDLMGEHLTGQPSQDFSGNRATEWGNFYEADTLAAYTKRTGKKVKPGTFLQHPTLDWCGGTPDGLVGEQGMIEAKCPLSFKNHLRTVINRVVPDEYLPQVLGHLWLSGREWVDFVSYDPRIKGVHRLAIVRVWRKDHLTGIAMLAERVTEFHELLLNKLAKLKVKPGKMIGV